MTYLQTLLTYVPIAYTFAMTIIDLYQGEHLSALSRLPRLAYLLYPLLAHLL